MIKIIEVDPYFSGGIFAFLYELCFQQLIFFSQDYKYKLSIFSEFCLFVFCIMVQNTFFLKLNQLFLFFVLKVSLEVSEIRFENIQLFRLIIYNVVIFIALFSFWLSAYSQKTFLILKNYQYSIFMFVKLLMILMDLENIGPKGHIDPTDFLKGIYFLYLIRTLFKKKVNPCLNFLAFLLLLSFIILFYSKDQSNKLFSQFIFLIFFAASYVFSIKFTKIRKIEDPSLTLFDNLGIGILAFEKKSKKIVLKNKFFETLIGSQINIKDDFRNYATIFTEFNVRDLKKSFKHLLKLRGKPAKPYSLFPKNLAIFTTMNLSRRDSKHESKKEVETVEDNDKNNVFVNILNEIDGIKNTSFDSNLESADKVGKKVNLKGIKINLFGKARLNLKLPKNNNQIKTTSTGATSPKYIENAVSFLKKISRFFLKLQFKFKIIIKSLFRTLPSEDNIFDKSQFKNKNQPFVPVSSFYLSKNIDHKETLFKCSIYHSLEDDVIYLSIKKHQQNEIHEALLEMQNTIGAIVSSISHELRTPLNCSLNLLETLANNIDEETFENYLQPIILSTKNLKFIINDLIDYSSLISEKFKINNSSFNLRNAITTTMDIVSLGIEQKGIRFLLDFDNHIPDKIKSDPNRIKQILLNLLGFNYFLSSFLKLRLL